MSTSAKHLQSGIESDLSSTARQVADDTKEMAQDLRSKVTPMLNNARERVTQVSAQLRDKAKDNAQQVDRYVHDNPWSFIGLGVVTGFLAGWYLLRRDR
jgi:ElaB/YqjD/DUF883 family membrane-anchored ribosome-binding protein